MTAVNSPSTPSPLSREAYIRRHLRFNVFAFLVDAGGWWLGMSFLSAQTILPYYLRELGAGDILIGLLPSLGALGYMLPQIFVAPMVERRVIQKRAVVQIAWLERIPYGILALLTLWLAKPAPALLIVLAFVCFTAAAFAMGFNTPGYATMLTKSIPADKRGRVWGVAGALGGLIGLMGAYLSRHLLERYGMPLGFALCFLIGFGVLILTVALLIWVREPEAINPPEPPPFREHWAASWRLLRDYPGFRRLLIAEGFIALASMGPAFYTVSAVERFRAGSADVGRFNITLIAASVVGGFLWGFISDHYGNRRTYLVSALFKVAAPLCALLAPVIGWYPVVFFLSGMAGSGCELANFNLLLEYAGETKVASFQGVRGLAVLPAWVLFPLLGGLLARFWGYHAVFAVSLVAGIGSVVMLRFVPDPRHRPVGYSPERSGLLGAPPPPLAKLNPLDAEQEDERVEVET